MDKIYVPPEQVEKAKSIDLLTFLQTYYPQEVVRETNNQWCTKTHNSLKMSNGFWHWCSRGIGGKNAVDFLEKAKDIEFPLSAKMVLDMMQIKTPIFVTQEEKRVQNLILPEKNSSSDRVISYLKSRGIDEEIIQKCIEKHLIYEEKYYHNVVFVGYDEMGNARYAGCRSTGEKTFKSDATGSNKMVLR